MREDLKQRESAEKLGFEVIEKSKFESLQFHKGNKHVLTYI